MPPSTASSAPSDQTVSGTAGGFILAIGETVISPKSTRKLKRAQRARYRFEAVAGALVATRRSMKLSTCSRLILETSVGIPESLRKAKS
jgi:hypothetical protein